jgi:hypothetical protein
MGHLTENGTACPQGHERQAGKGEGAGARRNRPHGHREARKGQSGGNRGGQSVRGGPRPAKEKRMGHSPHGSDAPLVTCPMGQTPHGSDALRG